MNVSGNAGNVSQMLGNALPESCGIRFGKRDRVRLSRAPETLRKRWETVALSTWETVCIPIGDTPVPQTGRGIL